MTNDSWISILTLPRGRVGDLDPANMDCIVACYELDWYFIWLCLSVLITTSLPFPFLLCWNDFDRFCQLLPALRGSDLQWFPPRTPGSSQRVKKSCIMTPAWRQGSLSALRLLRMQRLEKAGEKERGPKDEGLGRIGFLRAEFVFFMLQKAI